MWPTVYHTLESIKRAWHLKAYFYFCNRPHAYFLLFFELRDKQKVLQRNFNLCFKKTIFPIIEGAWFWKRANLSTLRHLTNQSMIPESDIMEGQHQRHASRLCSPFPLPRPPLWLVLLTNIFPISPHFLPFSPTAEPHQWNGFFNKSHRNPSSEELTQR